MSEVPLYTLNPQPSTQKQARGMDTTELAEKAADKLRRVIHKSMSLKHEPSTLNPKAGSRDGQGRAGQDREGEGCGQACGKAEERQSAHPLGPPRVLGIVLL